MSFIKGRQILSETLSNSINVFRFGCLDAQNNDTKDKGSFCSIRITSLARYGKRQKRQTCGMENHGDPFGTIFYNQSGIVPAT